MCPLGTYWTPAKYARDCQYVYIAKFETLLTKKLGLAIPTPVVIVLVRLVLESYVHGVWIDYTIITV